jgi:hypothetical protein
MMWRIRGDGAALLIKWSKAGLLVIPLMLVGLAIGSVGQELFNGTPLVTDTGWVAGFAVSAVLIRVIGRRLNACGDLHTLYDSRCSTGGGWAWRARRSPRAS